MESPEIHPVHAGHGGGARWLEITASVAALVVSFASIFIAVQHGKTMEKLVTANSVPYIEAGYSNATEDGKARLMINMFNMGVGPAHEKSFRMKLRGRYVRSVKDMIAVVCADKAGDAGKVLKPYANTQHTRFIPARDKQIVFFIDKTPANASYWDALDKASSSLSVEICYCSVFDECWRRVDDDEPKAVKRCDRDEATEFRP